jgi:hypothetical protein
MECTKDTPMNDPQAIEYAKRGQVMMSTLRVDLDNMIASIKGNKNVSKTLQDRYDWIQNIS